MTRYESALAAREAAWKRLEWAMQVKANPDTLRRLRHIYEQTSRRVRKIERECGL